MRFGHAIRLIAMELQLMYRITRKGVYWNSELFGTREGFFFTIKGPMLHCQFNSHQTQNNPTFKQIPGLQTRKQK